MTPAVVVCLPQPLHPVRRMFLDYWLAGKIPTAGFLRWFHMPNSDYPPIARCIVEAVSGG